MRYEFGIVTTAEDWEQYHFIRRTELFEGRPKAPVYDPNNADEHLPGQFPLLLKWEGRGIGTTRLDLRGECIAAVRLVAVIRSEQRKGHGRVLAARTEEFAREKGVTKLVVNAAADAVGFYLRIGFVPEVWEPAELVGWNTDSVQMAKRLGV
jgi:GNAT superfamily N-acetyltransferase